MNSPVSLFDVAKAAGVSVSTVSRVVCGKATSNRIPASTQNRVSAIARELGYQPNLTARDMVLGKPFRGVKPQNGISDHKSQMTEERPPRRQVGVILTPTSSANTLNLIPGLIPVLAAAGYGLAIYTVPADPGQLHQVLGDGVAGLLSCPSVYSAVSAQMAGTCPVIVLWPGAGKAMLKALGPSEADAPVAHSGQMTVGREIPRQPASPVSEPISMEGAAPSAPATGVVLTEQNPPLSGPALEPEPAIPVTPTPEVMPEPPPALVIPDESVFQPLVPPLVSIPDPTPVPVLEAEPEPQPIPPPNPA